MMFNSALYFLRLILSVVNKRPWYPSGHGQDALSYGLTGLGTGSRSRWGPRLDLDSIWSIRLLFHEKNGKIAETGNGIEDDVDLESQINLKVDSDEFQELLDAHNQELTSDELTERHEHEHNIEQLEYLVPVQSED
ncbi:hypothetical protein TNCV_1735571 [Trichonephila clavipes]|nr:hypothetical protein TNCV_1735571 [Trichonephila clavipes]